MNAFRTSLPGRIISLSIAFALLSGGLIPILGLHPATWLPFTLLIPVVGCVVGCILAVYDHTWSTMAMVVALPLLLWPYAMGLMIICNGYPQLGWLLIAAGGGMTAFASAGSLRRSTAPSAAPVKHSVA